VTRLAEAVTAVLDAASGNLAASAHEPVARTPETVASLLHAGEDVVAYEVLCDNLYEDDITVPRALLVTLRDAVKQVSADPARVDALLP
jgi:hypothetical protein